MGSIVEVGKVDSQSNVVKDRALHDEQIMQNYFVANLVYDNLHFKLFFLE